MQGIPALPSWKFSSPMTDSSMESSPNISPLLGPSPNQKIPLKTSVHFPITITICKHWSKFVTCSPSHGDCGSTSDCGDDGSTSSPKGFSTTLNKMDISEFWSVDFWKIISVGGGLGALQFFWSLKKGTRTFHFRSNEPSCNILGPLGRYDHPWKKTTTNKQINTHPWSAYWQKIQNSTFL